MTNDSQQLSANKQALLKIRELKQLLADAQTDSGFNGSEPIAIVSMACRFPRRAKTPEAFWQCLIDQTDEVGDIPEDRWDADAFHDDDPEVPGKMYARRGVFLDNLDLMDPEFFGISPREATWVDPQQRLLLEVGWEALERAAWTPEEIGEETGVFVGWMHNDYQNEASDSFLNLNPYIATGAAGSFLCGRLAYYLGLQGPSVAIDTACSSSLVALHLAIQSLQRRDCNRALVGGVNAIASPTTNILTCKLKALSPSGQSRAFDAGADGYLRGEGCGVIAIRRLTDAQAAGDPILGVIRGSAVGHNGFSSGLTAPNPKAQVKVIQQALERAGVGPNEVDYLEAHGTGTELGDPIEMQAAAAALAHDRSSENPLLVGSVKTNIGHLEAAAGMAGLIKVLLSMQHDKIPGQLNFETPNPHIPWDKIPVKVLTNTVAWPKKNRRLAGVSAFGMSGTNAHIVVEAPPQLPLSKPALEDSAQLIVLSGKNDEALRTLAEEYADYVSSASDVSLADVGFTANVGRSHFEHRAAVVASNTKDLLLGFQAIARDANSDSAFASVGRRRPKVAWQFTGQGSQYSGMAKGLYESQPVFRNAIDNCDQLLKSLRGESLLDVMFSEGSKIDHTSWTQPAIFALQMGMVKLLQSYGLTPDVVWGHSVGQYAAACTAGIMSWSDGLRLISERGRLIGDLPAGGSMLAVFATLEVVQKEISSDPRVSLAALNGTHIVVSGPNEAIETIQERFDESKIRCKSLTTSHAFHSSLMEPALVPFSKFADQIEFGTPELPIICNISGKVLAPDQRLDGQYWASHIREAVQFAPTIESAQELGCQVILEIGPQSVLTRMAGANWNLSSDTLVTGLEKGADDATSVLKAIGRLYVQGCSPDFTAMYPKASHRKLLLPTYPFQRRRFWGPDKPRAFHAEYHTAHPLLGSQVKLAGAKDEQRFESFIEPDSPSWLPDHEVMASVVLPGAAFIEMAIAAAEGGQVHNLVFEKPLRPGTRTSLQSVIQKSEGGKSMEVYSSPANTQQWSRNFTAMLEPSHADRPNPINRSSLETNCTETVEPESFYQAMSELGLNYGPAFQTIESIRFSQTEVLSRLRANSDIRGYTIPPTILDGALHSLAVGLLRENDGHLFLPVGMGRVQCFAAIENAVWCHASWNQNEGKNRTADLTLFDDDGNVVLKVEELRVQQVSIASLRQMSGSGSERLIYDLDWERFRLPAESTQNRKWLVVSEDNDSSAAKLSEKLRNKGHQVYGVKLTKSGSLECVSEFLYRLPADSVEAWDHLFSKLSPEDSVFQPQGIAWFTGQAQLDEVAGDSSDTKLHCTGVLNLAATLAKFEQRRVECGWQLVTSGAISIDTSGSGDVQSIAPQQSQFWGLGRVLGAEQPEFRCRLIDLPLDSRDTDQTLDSLTDFMVTETQDNQFAVRDGQFFVPRMKTFKREKSKSAYEICNDKSYLITGGLGMLGRQAAKWLAEQGAKQVVLVSRRSPDDSTQAFLDAVTHDFGCELVVHQASLADRNDVQKLFARFGSDLNPLAGLIHAAGVLDDGLLGEQNWERFEKVLAPKVTGASLLHEATQDLQLNFFILYSSVASILGSRGQSNYATANGFLDGLAWRRRAMGLPATSINWGPWTEGMANDERLVKRMKLQGITPLAVEEAHSAMEKLLLSNVVQATVIDVDWRRMQAGLGGQAPAMLSGLAPSKQRSQAGDSELVGQLKRLRGTARRDLLVATVQQMLQGILSTDGAPETDRPLIEMGLDSLMAVEFGTELQQRLGDQFAVGPTMLFDHPTIDAISDHVLTLVADAGSDEAEPEAVKSSSVGDVRESKQRDDVAIVGMSCRFPGAKNVAEFWKNLLDGVDSVGEIPSDRWDVDRFYSADRDPGKMYTREGGFLDDIADFDAEFFNISDQEACWIDPQHRMLLENSYRALEDAGVCPQPLKDSNVGVFMGIMGQDYAFLPTLDDPDVISAFQGAGLSHSAGVGRISYVFGFEGPSVAVDTASSSSLVALFQAVRSLQDGDCNLALAGGVNAILAPVNSLLMSKAGLLSPDGRCKSFSASADGFGRGEGCGVVVLKRLSDAQRDGDRIMAVVRGGAVVHNGFSSGITAPSGKSQTRAIREALQDAQIAPSQVQYLEAHGTGTEYGDPIELNAAAAVYGKGRKPDQPLLIGTVKANISHLEAAGGVSGLIKTVLALHHGVIPRQANFEEPSPHIPWKRMPVKMVTEETRWPEQPAGANSDLRIAGVTALGLVGTNAHVVLSSAPKATPPETVSEEPIIEREVELLVLSARNASAVKQMAVNYALFLENNSNVSLSDFCHTLSAGRRHFECRVAITVRSVSDAIEKLSWIAEHHADARHSNGNGKATKRPAAGWLQNKHTGSPKIGWLFDGRRDFDFAISRELFANEPLFRELVGEFDQTLAEFFQTTNAPTLGQLFGGDQEAEINSENVSDVHRFALMAGMAKFWEARGISADVVCGLGVGQYVATCVAGGVCFQDAIRLVAKREEVLQTLESNFKNETTVESFLDEFEQFADAFNYYPPNLPLLCSLTGEEVAVHRSLGGSYWREHLATATERNATINTFAGTDCDYILDLNSVSQRQTDSENGKVDELEGLSVVRCLESGKSGVETLLHALGMLYVGGVTPDFVGPNSHRSFNRLSLPPYPFQKKRYWITEVGQFVKSADSKNVAIQN